MENTENKGFDLDGKTFRKVLKSTPDAVLIDVRSPAEFYERTLPGAINLDYMAKDFEHQINVLDPAKTYFVFCRNGNRSLAACKAMEKIKLRVFKLRKGIGVWRS